MEPELLIEARERGLTKTDWLVSRHSFSFGQYYDERRMNFGVLRVINDDVVAPGAGFDMHPHRDMEIITVVFDGELAHEDSLGSKGVIGPGEVQVMSAGKGILHSEYNNSKQQQVHLLQIWILPRATRLVPRYDQRSYKESVGLKKVVGDLSLGDLECLGINQDVSIYLARCEEKQSFEQLVEAERLVFVHLVRGEGQVNGRKLLPGDGYGFKAAAKGFKIEFNQASSALVFDLPEAL